MRRNRYPIGDGADTSIPMRPRRNFSPRPATVALVLICVSMLFLAGLLALIARGGL
jgi:hypothetical protein